MPYVGIYQSVLQEAQKSLQKAQELAPAEQIHKMAQVFERLRLEGGSLVISGIGKSGIIGQKIASTFCSLGLPSFFLHPIEALHGDLGQVRQSDALIIISKSGTTEELLKLLTYLPFGSESIVGLLGKLPSPLSEKCGITFDCSVEKEACLNNLAPTTSTTLTLAIGDALAVVYEQVVGLSKENFAVNHPAGLLGKTLRLKVRDLMVKVAECPTVRPGDTLEAVILEMTKHPVGLCAVCEPSGVLKGVIVEGDIRRAFTKNREALGLKASAVMNANPTTALSQDFAFHALEVMEKKGKQVYQLPVLDQGLFVGVIRMHDLLKEGLIS